MQALPAPEFMRMKLRLDQQKIEGTTASSKSQAHVEFVPPAEDLLADEILPVNVLPSHLIRPSLDDVRKKLLQSPYPQVRSIEATASGNRITLTGVVPSFFLKQMAQEAIRGADVGFKIRNNIQVADEICKPRKAR